jgi:[acyl-carrier-protein] S-malonyltransferase
MCVCLDDDNAQIMDMDPYYITQDNGAGAPIHFATTYKQLDMLHHLIRKGAEVNQRDDKGFTALHRAAYLAQYEGYLQIYEYLLSEGADPNVLTNDYDPYLNPGKKTPIEVAIDDPEVCDHVAAPHCRHSFSAAFSCGGRESGPG